MLNKLSKQYQIVLCYFAFFLFFIIKPFWVLASSDVDLILSGDLKPYWEFVDGFKETHLFKVHVKLLGNKQFDLKRKSVESIVAVGHRALKAIQNKNFNIPLFGALILHPSLIEEPLPQGGLFLLLPPEEVFPHLKIALHSYKKNKNITMGIPFSASFSKDLVQEFAKKGTLWGFKVIPISLKGDIETLHKMLEKIEILYFLPDPFWESEEVIIKVIELAILNKVIVVGYNNFFLKKGALFAFIIDYQAAGKKMAFLVKDCLKKGICSWQPAPFSLKINKKVKRFYFPENEH